jgi:ArsR family transcriptional regulator, cadmium/lead-responsive transcriptional repressor
MLTDGHAADDVAAAVCLFRSLADPTRLAIISHLAGGEHRVGELTAHLGLAQSTVSQHLACLRDCGLVAARAQGRASYYSLARPELLDLLQSAERLLEATGEQVALCPNYGQDTGSDTRSDTPQEAAFLAAVPAPSSAMRGSRPGG